MNPTNLHADTRSRLLSLLEPAENTSANLFRALHRLAVHRAALIQSHLASQLPRVVQQGPFAGMRLLNRSAEGCYLPKWLGSYEQELHGLIAELPRKQYARIVNVGCAEGYYAVGLARLLPHAILEAYDRNSSAISMCRELASLNGMGQRVHVRGEFGAQDFQRSHPVKTLVVCDVEGAELALLDPASSKDLASVDLIVETHPTNQGPSLPILLERFRATHVPTVFDHRARNADTFPALAGMTQMDQFLALWEWRPFATPWVFFRAKAAA